MQSDENRYYARLTFVDGEQSTLFSEHNQAMVLALGIASEDQRDQILANLLLDDDGNFIQRESG